MLSSKRRRRLRAVVPLPAETASPTNRRGDGLAGVLAPLQPTLGRILRAHGIPLEDRDDLLQEVCLATFKSWRSIRDPTGWMIRVTDRLCINYWLRRRARALEVPVDSAALEYLASSSPPAQDTESEMLDLAAAFGALPLRYSRLLILRFAYGYTPSEVAGILGYKPSSIRKITQRAIALARERLGPVAPSPPAARPVRERHRRPGGRGGRGSGEGQGRRTMARTGKMK
jgi:RNA polymerase sigma factor (sigma-70 family)